MATVTNHYARIIYTTSSTATSYTVSADFYIYLDAYFDDVYLRGKMTGGFGTAVAVTSKATRAAGWYKVTSKSKTITKGTSSQSFSVSWYGDYWYGSVPSGDPVNYSLTVTLSLTIPALASYSVSYNANGGSGAPSAQTKYYGKTLTLSSTKPTRTGYTFVRWNTNTSNTGTAYNPGGSYTGNAALTLYAIWQANTWTVSYNANGGSGAPGNQTKTYGVNLTLSSTKPTRTGYTFLRWNTNSSGTGTNYNSGATYTANAALALYAVWQLNTYTVSYNANCGSGAPANQTKTYGVNLTLSSTVPTRTDYRFVEWNTAANGSGTSYAPGATYSGNAALPLYAIWESTYTAPKIGDVTAYRADSTGQGTEEGTYGYVSFNWTPGSDPSGDVYPTAIQVGYRQKGTSTYTYVSVSDLVSGTGSAIIGGQFDANLMYDIIVVLTPAGTGRSNISKTSYISVAAFIIDVNATGTAVAIGVQAPDDMSGFVMGFDPYISLDTSAASGTVDAELYDAICALGWQDDVIV